MDNLLVDNLLLLISIFISGAICAFLFAGWWHARKLGKVLVSEASLQSANESLSNQLSDLLNRNQALTGDLNQVRTESISYRERITQLQTTLTEQARQND